MRKVGMLFTLLLGALSGPNAQAEMWRCKGDIFTSNPISAEGVPYEECQKFTGSQVCGEGRNLFITPSRSGQDGSVVECRSDDISASPLVQKAGLEEAARTSEESTKSKRGFGIPRRSGDSKTSLSDMGTESLQQVLPLLDKFLGEEGNLASLLPPSEE